MRKSWFETLFDPFPLSPVERPPDRLLAFYRYFIHPVRWLVLAVLLVSLASTVVEMALYVFLGKIVDWANATPRAEFFATHGWQLAGMVFVVLVLEAGDRAAAARLQQSGSGPQPDGDGALAELPLRAAPEPVVLPQRFRRAHRPEGDADRPVAARDGGQPDRRHLDAGHLCRRHGVAVRRARCLADRAGRRLAGALRAHHLEAGAAGAPALGGGGRGKLRPVRPHRRQLHQHPVGQALRPRRARGRLRAGRLPHPLRCLPHFRAHHGGADGLAVDHEQRPHRLGRRAWRLSVEPRLDHGRRDCHRHLAGAPPQPDVEHDPQADHLAVRECRRGAERHADDRAALFAQRCAGCGAADGNARAPSASRMSASITAASWASSTT